MSNSTKEELFARLLKLVGDSDLDINITRLKKAYAFTCESYKGITRYSGDEYVTHPINVAIILAYLEAREDVIISGMMCDIFTKTTTDAMTVEMDFSGSIKEILLKIKSFDNNSINASEDEDVVFLKLAERLHNMSTVEFMDENIQKIKAKETIEFFVPFAAKLGNTKLTEELNDLALKYA